MYRYIIKRVLLVIPTLLGAAALVFVLMRLIPGDVCVVRLGSSGGTFDPKTAHGGAMADAKAFNEKVRVLFLSIGTAEGERFYNSVKNYRDALKEAGIDLLAHERLGDTDATDRLCQSGSQPTPGLLQFS